jgi:flagellar motor switch protein FliM
MSAAAVEPSPTETTAATVPAGPIFRANGARYVAADKIIIEKVDFRNPTFLAEGELRRLRSMHLEYLRSLTTRLSSLLRSEIALNLGKFGTQSCESFIEGLKSPTQISLFRVNPLNGVGYVEIPPKLAVALTTRILGGREPVANHDVYLTEIETALLEDVINVITAEWCEQWRDDSAMNAHLLGQETNPRFIQASAKGAMMLVVAVEVAFGRCEEVIQIGVPLSMIEPMMKRQQAARVRETGLGRSEGQSSWRPSYDDIAIPVHAEIVASRMTVASLLSLKIGEIIELPASMLEATRINVAGSMRFKASAGQQDGHIAVQITEKTLLTKK